MCVECYTDENRITPLLNPVDCLRNHTQYICGTCGRCICIEHDPKRGLQRWSEQRLYGLNAWREAPYYSDRERAALAWTEALTLVTQGHVSDDVYEEAREHFSEKELVDLSYAIIAINSRNRLAIAFRSTVGSYEA